MQVNNKVQVGSGPVYQKGVSIDKDKNEETSAQQYTKTYVLYCIKIIMLKVS